MAPLLAEINRLQRELDHANESVDDKLDKLEDAGHGVIGLTKKLDDARIRIVALEEELARLGRREERRLKRLEKARCLKCRSKVDLRNLDRREEADDSSLDISTSSLLSELSTSPGPTTEVLQSQLRAVNDQLEAMKIEWSNEKRRLLGEKAALQDTAQRLNAQIRETQSVAQKAAQAEAAGKKARSSIEAVGTLLYAEVCYC
jgi:DNA repair exonuclease SbcCD ATPase subunit